MNQVKAVLSPRPLHFNVIQFEVTIWRDPKAERLVHGILKIESKIYQVG
jgi:hypothetical protein